MKQLHVYRNNRIIRIKEGYTKQDLIREGYLVRHPDTIFCSSGIPSNKTLEKWMNDGVARALDGCRIEPDGTCEHDAPSWLIALHMI